MQQPISSNVSNSPPININTATAWKILPPAFLIITYKKSFSGWVAATGAPTTIRQARPHQTVAHITQYWTNNHPRGLFWLLGFERWSTRPHHPSLATIINVTTFHNGASNKWL